MATAPTGNIAGILDPSLIGDQLANAQQQALANALLNQGLTPMGGTQMAGNVAIRNSPAESIAKIAQILSGQNLQQTADQGASNLAARQSAALLPLYFGMQGQQGPSPASAALAQGAAQGQPGPTPMAAQAMSSAPQGPQNIPGPNGINYGAPGPLTMPGMDPRTAFVQSQTYPDQYGTALVKAGTPNDTSIQAMQGNMNPVTANRMAYLKANTDPKILAMRQAGMSDQQIYNAVFGAAAKAADIERRPGQLFDNSLTGERGMVGAIPHGSNVVGSIGPNGSIPAVAPIPGAQAVTAGNAGATSSGTAPFEMVKVDLGNGQTQMMTRADAAAYYGTGKTPTAPPTAAPMAPPAMPGRPTGQSTTDQGLQKDAAAVLAAAPGIGAQAKQSVVGLQNALGLMDAGTDTGPASARIANFAGVLNTLGLPVKSDNLENYQTLRKYLQNSLNQAAQGTGATGSDARFESFMHGQPDADSMNSPALGKAIRYVLSQQDAAVTRSNFLAKAYPEMQARGDPNAGTTVQQLWSGLSQPKFFEIQRMTPAEQATAVKGLSQTDAQKFIQWRKDIQQFQ